MKSIFISTKLRTTEDVDWAGPLKTYLTKVYGNTTDFTREVGIINKLRLDLTNSLNDVTNNLKAKDIFYKYYGQLELLDLRLPIQEHGVRVKFKWFDAYHPSTYNSQHSLAFEKASVLFNLGAILAYIAAENYIDGDYKTSYQYFQYSAGVYKFMSENFLHAPSSDLNGKTSLFLHYLQLSQAQEVFLLRLISEDESSKYALISKLAKSAASHYKQALESLDKLDEGYGDIFTWERVLKFKEAFFNALVFYYYGLSLEEKKIGQAIAYLKVALENFQALKRLPNDTTIEVKTYVTQTEDKLRVLAKDNDFIYHDTIPAKESLDLENPVKPLDAAKAIPIGEHPNISEIIGEDIFEKIIPSNIHEKLSYYSEEKAKILREQIENVETFDIELTSFLEYLRLPSSLNDFKNSSQNKLDPKLIGYCDEISESNLKDIKSNSTVISSKRQEILSLVRDLEAKLDKEEEEYNQAKFKGVQQEPSSVQSLNLRDDLTGAKQSLLSASKLDEQINEKITPEIENIEKLKNKSLLENEFFNKQEESLLDMDDSSDNKIGSHIDEILKILRGLNDLKSQRVKIIADLKEAIQSDDISNILVLNNKTLSEKDEKELFSKELLKFDPFISNLKNNHSTQSKFIDQIKINYNKIISSNTKVTQSVQKISRFEKSFKIFQEYETNFKKSVTFYSNLLNFVNEVKTNIDSFIRDRNNQRTRLLSTVSSQNDDLKARFNKLSVSSQSPRGSIQSQSTPNYSQQNLPQQTYQQEQSAQPPTYSQTLAYQQPTPPSLQQRTPSYSQPSTPSFQQSTPLGVYQQPIPNTYQQTPLTPSYPQQPQSRAPQQQPTYSQQQYASQQYYQPQQSQQQQQSQQPQQLEQYAFGANSQPSVPQVPNYPTSTPSFSNTYPSYQQQRSSYSSPSQPQQTTSQPTYSQQPSQAPYSSQPTYSQPSYSTPYDPSRPYP